MQAEHHTAQNPGVSKIRSLLLAARAVIQADGKAIDLPHPNKTPSPEPVFPDARPAIARMREHLQALRAAVLAESVGPSGANARDLTALTLQETDQSLEKLAQSFAAPDQASANKLRGESAGLVRQAKSTSVKAGKALGIPWPL